MQRAHCNPLGGMGMNGGIHDSFNLAEKLIPILRGDSDLSGLDRYDEERRGIAMEYVQRISIQNKRTWSLATLPFRQRSVIGF